MICQLTKVVELQLASYLILACKTWSLAVQCPFDKDGFQMGEINHFRPVPPFAPAPLCPPPPPNEALDHFMGWGLVYVFTSGEQQDSHAVQLLAKCRQRSVTSIPKISDKWEIHEEASIKAKANCTVSCWPHPFGNHL